MRNGGEVNLSLRVRQVRWEAEGVVTVLFEPADGGSLPMWSPGAHIDVYLPGGPVRQYSLCGEPGGGVPWRIGVLREPDSRGGSAAVHERLRPGEIITARGPRNNFELREATRYILVAGGIGITPILTMAREIQRRGVPWTLLYGGRRRAGMAFLSELDSLAGSAADRGSVVIHPQDEAGHLPLADALREPIPGTLIYCCGPAPLLSAIQEASAHWPAGSLVIERFTPAPPAIPAGGDSFEVEARRSGVTVTVPAGTTIVEALEEAGVSAMTSCLEGICGTCETKVIDGVPEHRDSLLSEAERESNKTMMICVGRARCAKLVLDI